MLEVKEEKEGRKEGRKEGGNNRKEELEGSGGRK